VTSRFEKVMMRICGANMEDVTRELRGVREWGGSWLVLFTDIDTTAKPRRVTWPVHVERFGK
jgi:hypothetical protein